MSVSVQAYRPSLLVAVIAIVIAAIYTRSSSMSTMSESGNKDAIAGMGVWADGPCPMVHTPVYETQKDDIWTTGATHMALIHNAILRGFNSVYLQAPHVKPGDYSDFIGYSLAWYKLVKSHHDDEEAELFPKVEGVLNEKGIWEETMLEHESFLEGLAAFNIYLTSLAAPSAFSGSEVIRIMDTFREPFTNHFHSEIHTIANFSNLSSATSSSPEMREAAALTFKTWGKKTLTKAGMTDVVPFALLNMDATFEDGKWANWPPMPGPVKWMLLNVFGSWNWGWWKFSSCGSAGMPRPLYALQGVEVK